MEKIEYEFKYKCRLCGEIFGSGYTRNRELVVKEIAMVASGIEPDFCHILFPHHCNDYDIGLADFIGVRVCTKN